MKFSVFQLSRIGGRENNEDRMGYCCTPAAGLFFVMDGMGGHPQGEVAADLALKVIAEMFQEKAQQEIPDVAVFLAAAVTAAHGTILRYATDRNMPDSPRTTIVAAVVQAGAVTWLHCGDSRLYVVRQGELLLRTRDHTFAEQRRATAPGFTKSKRINRNLLFTCLGSPEKPMFEISGPLTLRQGDRLMLCSDGLWASLNDADITSYLSQKPVSQAVPDLVESALRKAGDSSDNVTAIALEWETPDDFETTPGGIPIETRRDSAFTSTVFGDQSASEPEHLDDTAIERAIAEINETIRRTAAKKA